MFLDQFPEFLDSCNSLPGQICILGDFNIHYDRPHDPVTANTLDILNMYNLQQTVVQSAHRQGHVLDWVIVRPDEGIHQSTQVSDGLESDHRCVLVQFDVSVSRPPPVHLLVRNIRGIDRVAFKRDLEAEPCSLVNPPADQYNATLRCVRETRSCRQTQSD